ncbi:MAG: indole-3-glycerol phosphate synthase [Bacteroidales bacterium]
MERTAGILQEIVANKRMEVERQKKAVSLQTLLAMGSERFDRPVLSLRKALAASPSGIIAEFKRKSPSKGYLFPDAKVDDIVPAYSKAGAAACSILTDEKFFGGSFSDLQSARKQVNIPLLRKDFIIDEYQLFQSRALGADAVLLIAAALTESDCLSLAETAHSLDLEVLLEIHSEAELSYLNPHIDMLGINNRRLDTFHTDVATSFRLAEQIQGDGGWGMGDGGRETGEEKISSVFSLYPIPHTPYPILISESGLSDADTVKRLRQCGFQGFLIGESFMTTPAPGESLSHLLKRLL